MDIDTEKDAEADKDWEQQLRAIEEADKKEAGLYTLPAELKERYIPLLPHLELNTKLLILNMIDTLNEDVTLCIQLYEIIIKLYKSTGKESICTALKQMYTQYNTNKLLVDCVTFVKYLSAQALYELLNLSPEGTLKRVIDISRFLSSDDRVVMINLIHRTSIKELLAMIDHCNEPMAKHCRLCRIRRMNEVELRMRTNQIPTNLKIKNLPGNLPLYSHAQVWQADDEQLFTLNPEKGIVYFQKFPVDLVSICDKCLHDVFHACISDSRFDPLYILEPPERKEQLAVLRHKEQKLSQLITSIASERIKRRLRDFSLDALNAQRKGLRLESEAEELRLLNERMKKEEEDKRVNYELMIKKALRGDKNVLAEDRNTDNMALAYKQHYANLKFHRGYNEPEKTGEEGYKIEREDKYSWKLASVDPTGMPITKERAASRFGLATYVPHSDFESLNKWKTELLLAQQEYEFDLAEIAHKKREAELKQYEERILYVASRTERLKRKQELMRRTLILEEEARIDRRAAEKAARRALRIAGYEKAERELMEIEDDRSYKLRFYTWECGLAELERENMWNEECDQCAVDRFWGLDLYQAELDAHAAKVRKYYEERVEFMKIQCQIAKIIAPDRFTIEAEASESYLAQRPDKQSRPSSRKRSKSPKQHSQPASRLATSPITSRLSSSS